MLVRTPYGSPDGAHLDRANTVELYESELAELLAAPTSRIVVGRRGSGKTALVERLFSEMQARGRDVLAYVDSTEPAIDDLLLIEHGVAAEARVQRWEEVWRAAILRSFCTRLLCDSRFSYLDGADSLLFQTSWESVLAESSRSATPVSASGEVGSIAVRGGDLRRYLRDDRWTALERHLATVLSVQRPILAIIDHEALNMAAAPGEWMRCQWGLVLAIQRLAHGPLHDRLLVMATMRDEHFVALNAHDPGLGLQPLRLILETDLTAIERFVHDMVRLKSDRVAFGVPRVLSAGTIDNVARDTQEDALRYLLRHTRYVPRDFVNLANELDNHDAKLAADGGLDQSAIRALVQGWARAIGEEQFAAFASSLAALMRPEDVAAERLYRRASITGISVSERARKALRAVPSDRLTAAELDEWNLDHIGKFPEHLPDALWRSGLLGYQDPVLPKGHAVFFSLRNSQPVLPERSAYAFHPILIDALGMRHAGPNDPPTLPILEA